MYSFPWEYFHVEQYPLFKPLPEFVLFMIMFALSAVL